MLRERSEGLNGRGDAHQTRSESARGPAQGSDTRFDRFEVLPLDASEDEAARLPSPVRLTVTCSPKHGPDRSVEIARRLTALGHAVTVHLAARMVRDRDHLDRLLAEMADAAVDDVFLIGGDSPSPHGIYSSAIELLPVISDHPRRPQRIGIAGYPEGHPKIGPEALAEALEQKNSLADYITSQLCFDPDKLFAWIVETRERGVDRPLLVGAPGVVDRGRLLKVSMRIGVGPSLAFLRKQHGMRRMLSHPAATANRIHDAVAAYVGDPDLNIIGFHFYTFNQLVDTWTWERKKDRPRALAAHS
jgi:methylenetetrahydrofolate reductase (NADPH)